MKTTDLFRILFILMLSVNMVSCDDDDSVNGEKPEDYPQNEVINQLSENEKLLVGKWGADGGNPLFLYSDKTCITPDSQHGTYQYNPESKELITTSGWGIRMVKSLDNTTMVLQGVQTAKVWTYKRQDDFVDNQFEQLIIGTWKNTEKPETILSFSSNQYTLDSKKGTYTIENGKYRIYINIDRGIYIPNLEHIDCYTLKLSGEKLFKGTFKRQ